MLIFKCPGCGEEEEDSMLHTTDTCIDNLKKQKATLKAQIEEINLKDQGKTKEINILTEENSGDGEQMTAEELDKWAATEVMGWKWHELYNCYYLKSPKYKTISILGIKTNEIPDPSSNTGGTLVIVGRDDWHPSDPATGQIWLVVERLRELGWDFACLVLIAPREKGSDYYCSFEIGSRSSEEKPGPKFQAKDPNPCVAILRAARAAMKK